MQVVLTLFCCQTHFCLKTGVSFPMNVSIDKNSIAWTFWKKFLLCFFNEYLIVEKQKNECKNWFSSAINFFSWQKNQKDFSYHCFNQQPSTLRPFFKNLFTASTLARKPQWKWQKLQLLKCLRKKRTYLHKNYKLDFFHSGLGQQISDSRYFGNSNFGCVPHSKTWWNQKKPKRKFLPKPGGVSSRNFSIALCSVASSIHWQGQIGKNSNCEIFSWIWC